MFGVAGLRELRIYGIEKRLCCLCPFSNRVPPNGRGGLVAGAEVRIAVGTMDDLVAQLHQSRELRKLRLTRNCVETNRCQSRTNLLHAVEVGTGKMRCDGLSNKRIDSLASMCSEPTEKELFGATGRGADQWNAVERLFRLIRETPLKNAAQELLNRRMKKTTAERRMSVLPTGRLPCLSPANLSS